MHDLFHNLTRRKMPAAVSERKRAFGGEPTHVSGLCLSGGGPARQQIPSVLQGFSYSCILERCLRVTVKLSGGALAIWFAFGPGHAGYILQKQQHGRAVLIFAPPGACQCEIFPRSRTER